MAKDTHRVAGRVTPAMILAAHERGYARIAIAPVARASGRSETTVRSFLEGAEISAESERAICSVLGLPEAHP